MALAPRFARSLFWGGITTVAALALVVVSVPPTSAEPVGVPVPGFSGCVLMVGGSDGWGQTSVPASLNGKDVRAVAAGYRHSLALTSDGQVTAWGWNEEGQASVPASLVGKTVTAIAAGYSYSLALTSDGHVTAWGSNHFGETTVPTSLADKTVTAIAAGTDHVLALTSDGLVTAWGSNTSGQATVPASLTGKTVTAIAAGTAHSLAITSDGHVTAWGSNTFGQSTVPASLAGKTVTAIAAGTIHSLALDSDGHVTAWGGNSSGQTTVPTTVADKTVTTISAGDVQSAAITSDHHVVGWGRSTVPYTVADKAVIAVASGGDHSLVIVARTLSFDLVPTLTGAAKSGRTLTANVAGISPTPDQLSYAWYRDDAVISGAAGQTLTLDGSQVGHLITVHVTASKAGYADTTEVSDPIGPIAAGNAPTLQLTAANRSLRRGQWTTLTWTTDATDLVASGGWSGTKSAAGSTTVQPTAIGITTYTLTATNILGSTTAQVQVTVTRPATKFRVTAPKGKHKAGAKLTITVTGLEAGERYTVLLGTKKVASGTAKNTRPLALGVRLPTKPGTATIRITGDGPDRTGTTKVGVVRR